MIQIDNERCIHCGLCVKDCPALCFRLNDRGVSTRHEEHCLHCGHCAAICPRAAISLDGVPADSLPPLGAFPSFEDLASLARGRRSVRAFKDEPVSREVLLRALDVARYAPTGKNLENVQWLVIEGRERLRRIADTVVDAFRGVKLMAGVIHSHDAGGDPIFRGAPCAVFACADSEYGLSACNCDIAVTYLDLVLPTLGIGTCWAGFVMRAALASPAVRESMGVAEGLMPYAGLMVGVPTVKYSRVPSRRDLRVTWLGDE